MKMLEINDKEFINLNKVNRIKIKENRITGQKNLNLGHEIIEGYYLEFELDNTFIVNSKGFSTVEEAKMWLFEHTK